MTTFNATYSAEDNKIRIYFAVRIDADLYSRFKSLGFQKAPIQGCHYGIWSPKREDFALEVAGDITAEETTLAERAEAKADRLDSLADKNIVKANQFQAAAQSISRRFEMGQPILVGHHSERKARRDKAQMDSAMGQAVLCAKKVDYWRYRATGVERHANYKNRDDVRARRIKTLLVELRGYQRDINESYSAIALWEKIEGQKDNKEKFEIAVRYYSGMPSMSPGSTWSALDKGSITAEQAVDISLEYHFLIIESETKRRCIEHTLNRLGYERGELGEVMRFEGDLTPVVIQAFLREHGTDSPKAKRSEIGFNAESAVYLPIHLTGDLVKGLDLSDAAWRDLMVSCGYEVPAKKPRKTPASDKVALPLINPTLEDAQRLQALWNAHRATTVAQNGYGTARTSTISEFTQAKYSAYAKGSYSPYETIELDAQGMEVQTTYRSHQPVKSSEPVCRVRVSYANGDMHKPKSVIVITDKPTKTLPIMWETQH